MSNKIYTVRPGDTLSMIARTSGVGLPDLLACNPQIENPNLIAPGDLIVVPALVDRSELLRGLASETFPDGKPEWFKVALREESAGVRESDPSNPRIVEYLATCTDLSRADQMDDGTAWCAAFVNWCLKTVGIDGTNSASALSWARWGRVDAQPTEGSVVVWKRLEGPETALKLVGGHVAFLLKDQDATLSVLGGNQSNAVCRKSYPRNGFLADTVNGGRRIRHKYELVGFRRP